MPSVYSTTRLRFNRMKVDYTFDPVPNNNLWLCSVHLQDELVAQARGTKKSSKHAAAEEAVRKLRMNRLLVNKSNNKQQNFSGGNHTSDQPGSRYARQKNKAQLGELVILENSDNAICIINDTAQFNKVLADYKFTVSAGPSLAVWSLPRRSVCARVLDPKDGEAHCSRGGPRHTSVHTSCGEVQPKEGGPCGCNSRNQIMARFWRGIHATGDQGGHIGNQLLRKMAGRVVVWVEKERALLSPLRSRAVYQGKDSVWTWTSRVISWLSAILRK